MRAVLAVVMLAGLRFALVPSGVAANAQTPPPAVELARQVQTHYSTVRDFTADFSQTYRGALLKTSKPERGTVRIKKPGRMSWMYTAPEKKQFVSDGSKLYSYMPADNVVYVSDMPAGDRASTAVLFLAGHGDLSRDFTPALSGSQSEGQWQLDLTPKTPQAEFAALTVTVDRRSLVLLGLASIDSQGGSSAFVFTNLRENVGLADNQFAFTIPRGVEVKR